MITSAVNAAISPATPPMPPAIATIGIQTPIVPGWSGEGPRFFGASRGDPLVDPPVDLLLDPVEEAGDQLVVVGRAELLAGRDRRLQLVPRNGFHAETLAHRRPGEQLPPPRPRNPGPGRAFGDLI